MRRCGEDLSAGRRGRSMAEPKRVKVSGRNLRCQHCENEEFFEETAQLDRLVWGLFRAEGVWGHQAKIQVCARCGFAHFFLPVPEAPEMVMERRAPVTAS